MLKLSSINLGSEKPVELASFYEKVLDKKPDWSDGDWFGFSAGGCFIAIGGHDKVKGMSINPERILLNFETTDVQGEFERIKGVGATVIKEPYQMEGDEKSWIATFADLEGNYFQLVTPWEM